MPVIVLLVAAVILGGIVVVAMGHGGELARDKVELPAAVDLRTWSDVARYRPPPALLGYHAASTEQALMIIARSVAERDAEISWLRSRLAELQPESAGRGSDVAAAADACTPAGDSKQWAFADDQALPDEDQALADQDQALPDEDQALADQDQAATARSAEDAADQEGTATAEPPVQAVSWQAGPASWPSDS